MHIIRQFDKQEFAPLSPFWVNAYSELLVSD